MSEVAFFISGFGPFAGCPANPTAELARALSQTLMPSLHSADVIETSAVGALRYLLALEPRIMSCGANRIVLLHFGVDSQASTPALERHAYNEMDFRVEDARGWKAPSMPIDPARELGAPLTTSLAVGCLVERLGAESVKAHASTNPGRYICNFLYYNSLEVAQRVTSHAEDRKVYSLFCHVPPADTEELVALCVDLTTAIKRQILARDVPLQVSTRTVTDRQQLADLLELERELFTKCCAPGAVPESGTFGGDGRVVITASEEVDGEAEVAGAIELAVDDRRLTRIWVRENWQGRGVAAALVAAAKEAAGLGKFDHVVVDAVPTAVQALLRIGFNTTGKEHISEGLLVTPMTRA